MNLEALVTCIGLISNKIAETVNFLLIPQQNLDCL